MYDNSTLFILQVPGQTDSGVFTYHAVENGSEGWEKIMFPL
jgi:hypothetical protein